MSLVRRFTRPSLECLEGRRLLAGDVDCVSEAAECREDGYDDEGVVGDGYEMELKARLRGSGPERGEAELEADDDGREVQFKIEVEKAEPGSVHDVIVDGVVVGQMTINSRGKGKLRLEDRGERSEGQPLPPDFPDAGRGSVVQVGTILTGTLGGEQAGNDETPKLEDHEDDHGEDLDDDHEDDHGEDLDDDLDDDHDDDQQDSSREAHYSAVLVGDGLERGEAEFEREADDDQLEVEFEVEVEKATPGSVHDVAVDGVLVAQITIADDGRGRIRMSTRQEEAGDLPIPDNFPPNVGADSVVTVGTILAGTLSVRGDLNEDQNVDSKDIDTLFAAIEIGSAEARYDLDGDQSVGQGDVRQLVNDVIGTVFGDVNMDGVFDSADLVKVFQAGQYEDSDSHNSTWETGDWNGDGEFDSSDLVLAFQLGGFFAGARKA